MAHSPVVIWIGNIPSTLKLPHHLNLANIDVLRFGFYNNNWHNDASIQRNTQIYKLKGGGWVSIRTMSSYSSDTIHRPSDPELSSFGPSCPSVSLVLLDVVQPAIIVRNRKKCNRRWEKGEVFLTCSLVAKSYTMITQDYITNFVN